MAKRTKTTLAILAVAVVAALLLGAWLLLREKPADGSKTITVEVLHLDGAERSFTLHTDAEYLSQALLEEGLISGTDGAYGLFIDTVDGETADSAENQWWVFTVNGENGSYGADQQPLADGDVYCFSIYVS